MWALWLDWRLLSNEKRFYIPHVIKLGFHCSLAPPSILSFLCNFFDSLIETRRSTECLLAMKRNAKLWTNWLVVILKCKLRSEPTPCTGWGKLWSAGLPKLWWLCSTQFSGQQGQLFNQLLIRSKMSWQRLIAQERINTDLNQAKEVGQLRSERIREIVSSSVFQVASEFLKWHSLNC